MALPLLRAFAPHVPPRVPAPSRVPMVPPGPTSRLTSFPGNRAAGLLQNPLHTPEWAGC